MKIGLNGFTTLRCDLSADIEIARKTGFDYLEIRIEKIREYLKENSARELAERFQLNRVKPLSINSLEDVIFRKKSEFSVLEQECRALCEICVEIGCPYIIAVPGRKPDNSARSEIRNESISVLRKLGEIADGYGISISYEFMGFDWCALNKLEECAEIVKSVGMGNVGLVLDMFHFFVGGSSIASIDELDADSLHIVHINDAMDKPRGKLGDRDRLLPGDGIIPIRDILAALKRIRYKGAVSVEVLQEEYWRREPLQLCREARVRTVALLNDACCVQKMEEKIL